MSNNKTGRNELCSCGSNKKYKKCCGFKAQTQRQNRASILKSNPFANLSTATTVKLKDRTFKIVRDSKITPKAIPVAEEAAPTAS